MVDTPSGPQPMRAKYMVFPHGNDLPSLTQVAQHVTPELIFQPRYMKHPNGAKSVTEIIACDARPEDVAGRYARYTGHDVMTNGNSYTVELGRSRVVVVDPGHLSSLIPGAKPPTLPYLAGLTVATESLETVRKVLRDSKVPFAEPNGRIVVGASDAFGGAVLFEAANANAT
jgi:hypothetical protein